MNPESSLSAIRTVFSFIAIGLCVLAIGCRDNAAPTVWTAEARSPDGLWLATARTDQNGGFGSASIETEVFLLQANVSQPPIMVLGFSCEGPVPRAYVLDNNANAGGTINLTMKWVTPSHLDVTYNGHAILNFQAVKCAGVDISVRDLSKEAIKTSP